MPATPKFREEDTFQALLRDLPAMVDPRQVCESVYTMLELMLRRDADRALLTELSEVVGQVLGDIPFDGSAAAVRAATRNAARACIKILQTAKEKRAPRRADVDETDPQQPTDDDRDIEYWLPPHLAHLLARTAYIAPDLPEAKQADSFDALCLAAIDARIDRVLTFFQRHNPALSRDLPPPFLFSGDFAARFKQAVATFIHPILRDSRQVRLLSTNIRLAELDTTTFWDTVDSVLKAKLLSTWNAAWDDLKLIEGQGDGAVRMMQIKDKTKSLRAMLQPEPPDSYDLPKIGNREIGLFASLLDTETDWWEKLGGEWRRFHDFYEQEKDPRVFQQKAREGVLRDNLLAAAEKFPEQWGDFLVLLCHRVFPRVTISFLDVYATNLGLTDAQREQRAPYLMRYLRQVADRPEIRDRERNEEEQWNAELLSLRQYLKGFT
jgi:phage tail protein X